MANSDYKGHNRNGMRYRFIAGSADADGADFSKCSETILGSLLPFFDKWEGAENGARISMDVKRILQMRDDGWLENATKVDIENKRDAEKALAEIDSFLQSLARR